jgi:NhaP-type Na+/H+ or K+/H+ antiporter
MCLIVSEPAGASMFIASFVAGLTVQFGFSHAGRHSIELTEQWGQVFNLSVFLFFGIMAARVWTEIQLPHLAYAAISLTIVRMLPVAVALRGTRLAPETILFMGWFGPRGLASIVLGLVYLEHASPGGSGGAVRLAVIATVLLSIFAHGVSALPGMEWYARRIRRLPSDAPERSDSTSGSPLHAPSP